MKRWIRVVGGLCALGLFGYFALWIYRGFDLSSLRALRTQRSMTALALAILLYGLIIPISGTAWKRLLASMGERRTAFELSAIMGMTQAAKYLPGNIAQHASRAVVSVARGIPIATFGTSVVLETLLAVGAAAGVTLLMLAMAPQGIASLPSDMRWPMAVAALLLSITLLLLPFTYRGMVRTAGRLWPAASERWQVPLFPSFRSQFGAFGAYVANYLLIGVGFLLIARAVGLDPDIGYMELTAAFSAAWIAGFLAPGVPAGLGVREGMMVLMLGGGTPSEGLLAALALMRIATVVGDLGWFALGSIMMVVADNRRLR